MTNFGGAATDAGLIPATGMACLTLKDGEIVNISTLNPALEYTVLTNEHKTLRKALAELIHLRDLKDSDPELHLAGEDRKKKAWSNARNAMIATRSRDEDVRVHGEASDIQDSSASLNTDTLAEHGLTRKFDPDEDGPTLTFVTNRRCPTGEGVFVGNKADPENCRRCHQPKNQHIVS